MTLNKNRREGRRLLASAERIHAAVESCFPPSESNERVLWRLDADGVQPQLYIVSKDRPSFAHLQEQAGWPEEKTWGTIDYSGLLAQLDEGQTYRFRLTANPVHVATVHGKKRRLAHVTVEQQVQWLSERQNRLGMEIIPDEHTLVEGGRMVKVTHRELLKFRRQGSSRPVTISRVTYEGIGRVTDPEALKLTLVEGIGHAKAYGCGLLTVARYGAR